MRQRLLVIEPDIVSPIQPASIDLRLGDTVLMMPDKKEHIHYDPDNPPDLFYRDALYSELLLEPEETYYLQSGEFILVSTRESIGINPMYEGIITGKSSWARIGLQIESAGYIDPGWGCPKPRPLTLEIKNLGPFVIELRPGMKICQLRIATMNSTPGRSYGHPDLGSHYADSDGPVSGRFGSRSVRDVPVVGNNEVVPEPSPA
jgi:dCTP deaminase